MNNKKYRLNITLIIILINLIFNLSSNAQPPEKLNYQVVVRNNSNDLVVNQTVGVRISILQGSVGGDAVYTETHSLTSNDNGLVNVEIGAGTVIYGDFPDIDWAKGPYFIKTETRLAGESDYSVLGTSRLLSVPYAIHAKIAETVAGENIETDPVFNESVAAGITDADTAFWNKKQNKLLAGEGIIIKNDTISIANANEKAHFVGELYGGGIVFYVDLSGAHGLIASLHDLDDGSGTDWGPSDNVEGCESMTDGAANTAAMIAAGAEEGTAAFLCANFSGGGYSDWYLPSQSELNLLCALDYLIDRILANDGNSTTNGLKQENGENTYAGYWSSTENEKNPSGVGYYSYNLDQFTEALQTGGIEAGKYIKGYKFSVRAVRAF